MRHRRRFAGAFLRGVCALAGCHGGAYTPPPDPILYPVKGKVIAEGRPLAHAVVTFLQMDEKGTTSIGETDDDGVYELSYLMRPGTAAATYKVAISYLVGKDGTVYGLAPRSGLAKPYGMITAKERIPPTWSDLGRTTHRATVPENGATFDFEITDPFLPPPAPDTPAEEEPRKGATGGEKGTPARSPTPDPAPSGPDAPGGTRPTG